MKRSRFQTKKRLSRKKSTKRISSKKSVHRKSKRYQSRLRTRLSTSEDDERIIKECGIKPGLLKIKDRYKWNKCSSDFLASQQVSKDMNSYQRNTHPESIDYFVLDRKEYKSNYDIVSSRMKELLTNRCQIEKVTPQQIVELEENNRLQSLATDSQRNFRDYQKIVIFQCNLLKIFYYTQYRQVTNKEYLPVLSSLISKYIGPLYRVGEDGAYGSAYKVGWKRSTDSSNHLCLIKVSNGRAREYADLFHELAIGLVLNELRKEIPYFMYVFGGFYCNANGISSPSPSMLSCNTTKNSELTPYGLYELIDGPSLRKMVERNHTLSLDVVASVILQIAYALKVAQERYQYMHFDLHSANVLVRSLPTKQSITLRISNTDYNMSTSYIPMIIDYGRNAMTVDNQFVCNQINLIEVGQKLQLVDDVRNYKDIYFLSLLDIWRYLVAIFVDMNIDQYAFQQEFWTYFIEPIRKLWKTYQTYNPQLFQTNITPYMYAFINTDDIKNAQSMVLSKEGAQLDASIDFRNKELFKLSIDDYLQQVLSTLPDTLKNQIISF